MALTEKVAVHGSLPSCASVTRPDVENDEKILSMMLRRPLRGYLRNELSAAYRKRRVLRSSHNIVDYLSTRVYDVGHRSLAPNFGLRSMLLHHTMNEHKIQLGLDVNKVFCSTWLDHNRILYGTKSNQIFIYDINRRTTERVLGIRMDPPEQEVAQQSGVHSMSVNPSGTLLATNGYYSNDLAVYSFPSVNPLALGSLGHKEVIFDTLWLDERHIVSCSRDTRLSMWQLDDNDLKGESILKLNMISNLYVATAKKFRAMALNTNRMEFATFSLNGFFILWDAERFRQVVSRKVELLETVCGCFDSKSSQFVVGTRSHIAFIDSRSLQLRKNIVSDYMGLRSITLKDDILTIGTGAGVIMFYDLRACDYIKADCGQKIILSSKVEFDNPFFYNAQIVTDGPTTPPAIYTHSYDKSGLRLFAAGGPLLRNLYGGYAAIWQ